MNKFFQIMVSISVKYGIMRQIDNELLSKNVAYLRK